MAAKNLPVLQLAPPIEAESPPMIPAMYAQPGISIAQITAILIANRKITALIASVIVALAWVVIKLMPKAYDATATIMVNYEVNDPLGGKEFPLNLLDNYISTQLQIMQSPEVLRPVIDQLNLTSNEDFTTGYRGLGTQSDWVMEQLKKRLTVSQRPGTQLIYVSATSKDPEEAARIANTVVNVYLNVQQKRFNDPAALRANRYSQQLAELKEKVAAAQQKVTDFRQQTGLTAISANGADAETVLLTSLEQKYQEAQNARRLAEIRQKTDKSLSADVMDSQLIQGMKNQLSTQEAQMATLRATLGTKHPKVVELQSQMDATRAALERETSTYTSAASSELTAARQLEEKLRVAVEAQRLKLVEMRKQQDEGAKLLVELESAQQVYRRALDGYDQIMAAAAGHYSNINLLNEAQIPVKATKPNKPKLFILGCAVAVFFGAAGPFLFGLIVDRRVRCRDDIERDMGVPVLAEL